jgi:putative methionine-R-sulfoxide reductase with GAF domain
MQVPAMQTPCESGEASLLLNIFDKTFQAKDLGELTPSFLKGLLTLTGAQAAFLFLEKSHLPRETFFQVGLAPEMASTVASFCHQHFCQLCNRVELFPEPVVLPLSSQSWLSLYPIPRQQWIVGLLGLVQKSFPGSDAVNIKKTLSFFACCFNKIIDQLEYEKQINNLNTYLNISSLIAQALDLPDVLEAVLDFCMESFSAEAASVLLLDYEQKKLRFFSVEGPAKPVLLMASFPADQGLAGAVLQTQQSEIINDVQNDPRFYGKFDKESGFITKNMMVIPLSTRKEKIGVLEILNKLEGDFLEEDLMLLQTIAEEIAFAIRNAKLFEVVVKSYCKIRQGENSCRGCKRPLGSWTPCVKYREGLSLM